jgi:Rrf2 family protein
MKLTTRSEYSLLAMIFIARNQKDGYVRSKDISEFYGLSKKYMDSFLSILKQQGLLKAKTGKYGGFRLARSADRIFLAEIVRTMDGPLAPTDSVSEFFYSDTPLSSEGQAISFFREIRDYIAHKMEKTSLAEIL